MRLKTILVFPCGSEIGLEIERSLRQDFHFHLIGGGSVKDHGGYVYSDVIDDLPWLSDQNLIPKLRKVVEQRKIDLIYPANDMTIAVLKRNETELGCKVVAPPIETVETCLSKIKTYERLRGVVRLPRTWQKDEIQEFPVFAKPDIGHSSIGAQLIRSHDELMAYGERIQDAVFCEYLPGDEYTIDCLSDSKGRLLFSGARVRARRMNGISVSTVPVSAEENKVFHDIAERINSAMPFVGAWFFQMKKTADGVPVLMEVAARFGGSSSLHRALGINFAALSVWSALGYEVTTMANSFSVEMDRALDNKFKLGLNFDEVFLDFDDTIVMTETDKSINPATMRFVFACINRKIKLTVLSRHDGDLMAELKDRRIDGLFERVIHLPADAKKSDYIDNPHAIFIDDSFSERKDVLSKCGIPVFGLDMIEALLV